MSGWFNIKGGEEDLIQGAKIIGGIGFVGGLIWLYDQLVPILEPQQYDLNAPTAFDRFLDLTTTTLTIGAGVGALATASWIGANLYYQRKTLEERNVEYVQIIPHAYTRNNPDSLGMLINELWVMRRGLIRSLKYGKGWFQFLISCQRGKHRDGDIFFYLGYPKEYSGYLKQSLKNCYPNGEIITINPHEIPITKGEGAVLYWLDRFQKGLPLREFDGKERFANVLAQLRAGTMLSITFRPVPLRSLKKAVVKTERYLKKPSLFSQLPIVGRQIAKNVDTKELSPETKKRIESMYRRTSFGVRPFEVQVSVVGPATLGVANSIKSMMDEINQLRIKRKENPISLAPHPTTRKMIWTADELANLLQLPSGKTREQTENGTPHIFDRIPHLQPGQFSLPAGHLEKGIEIGYLVHPAYHNRPVRLLEKKLRNMALVLGTIGSGKTSLILKMFRSELLPRFLEKKPFGGFTFIDPKGEGVLTMLTDLRKAKIEGKELDMDKIHYFDLSSPDFSIGLNLLERHSGETIDEVLRNALEVIGNAFRHSSWFEKYARMVIKALLYDKEETHTILSIPEFVRAESPLRERIKKQLEKMDDADAKELWLEIVEKEEKGEFGGAKMDPLLVRLSRMKDNPITRKMFGQKKTSIDVLKYLEEGHIVLISCQGLAEDEMKLVMGYIVSLYHKAAAKRTNKQQNHYLVIDEAHNVQLDILHREILPKDRSKGLALILLTQYLDQFNDSLKMAITEISGNIISFRSGKKTANEVEKMTGGKISAQGILGLDGLHAYCYTDNDDGKRVAFMIKTDPPYIYDREGKPTYYGEDEQRASREQEEAWQEALEEIGIPLMQRDCLTDEEARKQISENLEKLWEETPTPEDLAGGLLRAASDNPKFRKKRVYVKK